MSLEQKLNYLCSGIPVKCLPPKKTGQDPSVPHAPVRTPNLNKHDTKIALQNALRYFPPDMHQSLLPEFLDELMKYGHIYMYRFLPTLQMKAYPIEYFPCHSKHACAMAHMILNNLDPRVAQFPHELVTYGGNGQVFNNWAQFWLTLNYLTLMTDEQTLVLYSGHPMGLYPSSRRAPRMVITNGMMVPNYSSREEYDRLFALGVTSYGQMTAGSFCYIGPQGIVHGTTLTVLNAGRIYLKKDDLAGKVFVTSGLGGMSGAQAKAAVISGCIGVIAEVDEAALNKRHEQGWVVEKEYCLDRLVEKIRKSRERGKPLSIGYLGNVVHVWEKLVKVYEETGELLVELGSDQTSLHNPFQGGYYPVQLSMKESLQMMKDDPSKFKELVQESLRRQVAAINKLSEAGMFFWDYGNSFLLEAHRAGADVLKADATALNDFKFPSYVQHIMGDIFSLGFGPFRWVCTSGRHPDLQRTDQIAAKVLEEAINDSSVPEEVSQQYRDNLTWIKQAEEHQLVVGSEARILYSDQEGRVNIALAFNEAIATGDIQGPVVISRDHHDVSGTDSPFRETSNIYDGSALCADMAVHNCIGDSFRGATWVALHNGGGVGWGEVMNGGFGLVLDGTKDASERARDMLTWDVANGVSRRSWSGSEKALRTIKRAMEKNDHLLVTLPEQPDLQTLKVIDDLVKNI
ncbi:hypothetical protein HELRODRAFT_73656 [Helobdella robusta]|uniref:Urocanate hydratase n=1 Tax=Helobdella robusta TaxID=6412 RepID=T1G1G9_HELRO|nr:hypothetical protein HELRODRAFT_73656 [Helobdella robusta]ESO09525.1 hypothetical protein HELRODRAFT_73656 [Helobdella robusta]